MPRTTKKVTTVSSSPRGYMPASKTVNWATPDALYRPLHRVFHFTLDAAASDENAKCKVYFTASDNGLAKDWGTHTVWLNPPYGRVIRDWMEKALHASRRGATVVMLVPARTDTFWFHEVAMRHASKVIFIRGRLKFGGSQHPAPFPCIIVVLRPTGSRKTGPRVATIRVP